MTKHKVFENALIVVAILLIIATIIFIKNPTIVGYAVEEEYIEYVDGVNLDADMIPELLENKKEMIINVGIKSNKLSNYSFFYKNIPLKVKE